MSPLEGDKIGPKQERPEDESTGAKLLREVELIATGTKDGVSKALSNAVEHPGEALTTLGTAAVVGGALSLMQSRAGTLRLGAQVVCAAFGISFMKDVYSRAGLVGDAIGDTWTSGDNFQRNKSIIEDTAGPFAFDTGLMIAGGAGGARLTRIPKIQTTLGVALDGVLPYGARFTERKLIGELSRFHPESAQHSGRVQSYANLIAEQMRLPAQQRVVIDHASRMHDIGKLDVKHEILDKPGRHTREERLEMQQHAEFSFDRLSGVEYPPWLKEVPKVAASHHEFLDGTGYGKGLKGNEIPLESRVITVADVFDAMTSVRTYKTRMPFNEVFSIMNAHVGTHFDPQVISALNRVPLSQILKVLESAPNRPSLPNMSAIKGLELGEVFRLAHHEQPSTLKAQQAREFFKRVYEAESVKPQAKKPPRDPGDTPLDGGTPLGA